MPYSITLILLASWIFLFQSCAKSLTSTSSKNCRDAAPGKADCGASGDKNSQQIPEIAPFPASADASANKAPVTGPVEVKQPNADTHKINETAIWDCAQSKRDGDQHWTCGLDNSAYRCNQKDEVLIWKCKEECVAGVKEHYCKGFWTCDKSQCRGEQLATCVSGVAGDRDSGHVYGCNSEGDVVRKDCGNRGCLPRKSGCEDVCVGDEIPACKFSNCLKTP